MPTSTIRPHEICKIFVIFAQFQRKMLTSPPFHRFCCVRFQCSEHKNYELCAHFTLISSFSFPFNQNSIHFACTISTQRVCMSTNLRAMFVRFYKELISQFQSHKQFINFYVHSSVNGNSFFGFCFCFFLGFVCVLFSSFCWPAAMKMCQTKWFHSSKPKKQ